MCDFASQRRSKCQKSLGKWLEPVKRSKWELPCPDSRPYWEEIITELEKNYKRVRYPHPPPLSLPNLPNTSIKTTISDISKSKVSPPSLMHKTQQTSVQSCEINFSDNLKRINGEKEINKQFHDFHKEAISVQTENTKIRSLNKQKQINRMVKIYSKQYCPYHKNTKPVKIFDDDISDCLPPIAYTRLNKPNRIRFEGHKHTTHTHHHRSPERSSAPIVRSKFEQRSTENKNNERRSKAPKLCMANLVPSFAKRVSTDSSIGTRESLESETEINTETNTEMASASIKRDYLHVPKLNFVSVQPISQHFSSDDSCEEKASGQSFLNMIDDTMITSPAKNLELNKQVSASQVSSIEEKQDSENMKNDKLFNIARLNSGITLTFSDLERKYALKALSQITKYERVTLKPNAEIPLKGRSFVSKKSEESFSIKLKKNRLEFGLEEEKDQIEFQESHCKLKEFASKYSHRTQKSKFKPSKSHKAESITLYSSSRSTSGTSQDFDTNILEVPSKDTLENIPQTIVFRRAYIDKCNACLYKPFKTSQKVFRELPLAMLISIIDNPSRFQILNASSSSSSENFDHYTNLDSNSNDQNLFDFLELDTCLPEINIEDEHLNDTESKLQLKVTFDNDTPIPKDSLPVPSLKDKNFPTKTIPEQQSTERSLSIQSSERSKTSTQNNQSSDSDDSRPMEDKVVPSKYKAPCHAPTVFCPSLEPFRALKQKKATSLRARAAALTAKSSEGSDSDETNNLPKKLDKTSTPDSGKEVEESKKKKKAKKPLIRLKTIASEMMVDNLSSSGDNIQERTSEKIKILKRAKTTFDLTKMRGDSTSEESEIEEKQNIEKKQIDTKFEQEDFLYSDIILMHTAKSPPPVIMTNEDVIDTIKACLQKGLDSPANLLERLSEEFIHRLEERYRVVEDKEVSKYLMLGRKLFNALVNSRRYLKPKLYCPNLEFSQSQPLPSSELQEEILPEIYELLAPILKMPYRSKKIKSDRSTWPRCTIQSESDNESNARFSFDMQVHPPTEQDSFKFSDFKSAHWLNPYASFLRKPRRKAVIWRELREDDMRGYDPEATLEMRAARLMDRICKDFCEWSKRLGGNDQVIDEDTLKDMFEINFTAEACKAIQVVLKEMPTVPIQVASVRKCLEKSELEATRRQIRRDKRLEQKSKRTIAFGRCLPDELRFEPPHNPLSAKWTHCEHIPKDVETMDDIWTDNMHLDSVSAFMDYLKDNSQAGSSKLLHNLQNRKKGTSVPPADPVTGPSIAGETFVSEQSKTSGSS